MKKRHYHSQNQKFLKLQSLISSLKTSSWYEAPRVDARGIFSFFGGIRRSSNSHSSPPKARFSAKADKGKKAVIGFALIGVLSLAWFLYKTGTKPSRINYPCQKAAATNSVIFLSWLGAVFGGHFLFKRLWPHLTLSRLCIAVALLATVAFGFKEYQVLKIEKVRAQLAGSPPMGTPKGLNPGRVVWVHDSTATTGNYTNYWTQVNQTTVDTMLDTAIKTVANQPNVGAALSRIFPCGASCTGRKVAIKVNMNNIYMSPNSMDANYQTVKAFLKQITTIVPGVFAPFNQSDVYIYDASREIAGGNRTYFATEIKKDYPDVHIVGIVGSNGAESAVFSRESFIYDPNYCSPTYVTNLKVPQLIKDVDYLINMPLLKGHSMSGGSTLGFKNLFGNVANILGYGPTWNTDGLHGCLVIGGNPKGLVAVYTAGFQNNDGSLSSIDKKMVLTIGDGLYGDQESNTNPPKNWRMFGNGSPNSLFISQDPVAVDSVMFDTIMRETRNYQTVGQEYLEAAAQRSAGSLGVHEHPNQTGKCSSADDLNCWSYRGASANGIDFVNCDAQATPDSRCVLGTSTAGTSVFSLQSSKTAYTTAEEIPIQILMNSETDAANVFSAQLNFPAQSLTVDRIDITGSFVSLWTDNFFDNTNGKVSLIGSVPDPGYKTNTGQNVVMATVVFKSKLAGSVAVSFDPSSQILRNSDNANILTTTNNISLTVSNVPTPTPCTITQATWNPTTTTKDSTVSLNVTGAGNCDGKAVSFEVRRNGLGDDPAVISIQPQAKTFATGSATLSTNWTAEHNPLLPLTDPDYYFNATVDGVTTKSSDPMLHVTRGTPVGGQGPEIAVVTDNLSSYPGSQVPQYSKFEITFNINNTVATNLQFPYDDNPPPGLPGRQGISVDGLFTADNWATTITQPGFLYQDYDRTVINSRDHLYPKGNPVWKVRFAPKQTGTYHYKLRVTDASGTREYPSSGDLSFNVGSPQPGNHGFIQVSQNDKRYFEFSDGTPFSGVGAAEGWSDMNSLDNTEKRMSDMAANGLNFFRTWMSGSTIAGSAWGPWIWYAGPWYGGYLPNPGLWVNPQKNPTNALYNPTASNEEFIFALSYNPPQTSAPCLFRGWMNPPISVKPNTTYKLQVRALAENVTGPRNATNPNYGLTLKIAGWPMIGYQDAGANQCPDALATYPALTPHINGNGWQTVEQNFTTTANQNFIDFFYMVMDNVNAGSYAHVAEVSMKEVLPDGSLGPEILVKSKSDMHTDYNLLNSWKWDYILDKTAEKNVFLKLVVMEKNDRVWNMIKPDGSLDTTESNNNFYGVDPTDWSKPTKIRRLQEYYYRYLAARWGYSPAVHSWEFINEGDPYSGYHYQATNNFAKFMHQIESSRHLVTTSNWHSFPVREFWGNSAYSDVDYADIHNYINVGTYNWSPPSGTTLETAPANVMGGTGGSIRVPAGRDAGAGDLGYPIKGQGRWTVSVSMKIDNFTGACPYGAPANLAGPYLRLNMGGTGGFTRNIPYDSAQPDTYFICTNNFTGTRDWTKFSGTFDIPDNEYHDLRVGFSTGFGTTGTAWFDNLEITDPSGKKLPINVFGDGSFDDRVRIDQDTAAYTQSQSLLYSANSPSGAGKPIVRGETGITDPATGNEWAELSRDTQGIWLHKYIWGQINPGGMADLYWWRNAIDANNLWPLFKPYTNFISGIPLNNGHYEDISATVSNSNLRAWGQKDTTNGKAHLWIDNKTDTWYNVVNNPTAITSASGTVSFSGMPAGAYTVSRYDTYQGSVYQTDNINVDTSGTINLTVSNLTTDMAVKVERQGTVSPTPTLTPTSTPTPSSTPSPSPVPTVTGTPTPSGNLITLNPATTYQTINGWEAASYDGMDDFVTYPLYKNALYDQLVNDVGINRVRLGIRSGIENSQDFYTQYRSGQIDYATWRCVRYATINDDNDPNNINLSGFQFSQFDKSIDNIVLPMKQRLEARGEKLHINLNYGAFTAQMRAAGCPAGLTYIHNQPAEYAEYILAVYQHMQQKYGFVPDTVEVILEPDNVSEWASGTVIGNAINATITKLEASGFAPKFVVPSNVNMSAVPGYFDAIKNVIGDAKVRQYIQEISYHRYAGVNDTDLQGIANRSVQYGIGASMLEWWVPGNTYQTLHKDLTMGRNTAWQQDTILGILQVDSTDPNNPQITVPDKTKYLRQYYKYTRSGAQRIEATSSQTNFEPLAFINRNGTYVVVVKAASVGNFSLQGLPAGTYGIKYTTSTQYDIDSTDQTLSPGQTVTASIPAAGVITIYGKTPSVTPTPTPTSTPCTLTSGTWGGTTVTEGNNISLNVTATGGCSGKQVSFEVRRNGLPLIGDIQAVAQPQAQTFASGSATLSTNWVAEHNPQFPLTDPDYYFNATVDGVTTKSSDPMLHVTPASGSPIAAGDWPQLGHDAQRTSVSPQTVDGPYRFYWRWTDVAFASRIQPVVVDNRLFIGGLNGVFYAVDADQDNQGQAPTILWQRDLKDPSGNYNSPIRSGAGVDTSNNTVIVGTQHGLIYGLDTVSGNQKWTVKTDGAILASPVVTNGTAYIGSSDGNFYSINTSNGNVNWKYTITDPLKGNIPILGSAATTADNSRVFFVAENVKAYALATSDGHELWNQQLQGQSGADRWPVVLNDVVTFRTQSLRPHSDLLHAGDAAMDLAGALLSDWSADWNIVRPQIVNHLTTHPEEQTFFALDINSGQPKGLAPVLGTMGNSDPPALPIVYNNAFYLSYRPRHGIQTDGGSVHVTSKYDAELGRMDPATLDITGLTSPDRFSYQFRMTSDESANLTIAGDLLLVDSWERLGGIKLTGQTNGNLVYIAMSFASGPCNWGVGGPHIPFYDNCPTNDIGAIVSGSLSDEGRARTGAVVASGRIFWFTFGLGAIGPRNNVATIPLSAPNAQPTMDTLPGPVSTPSAQALANYVWTEPQRPTAIPDDLRIKLEQEVSKIISANNHLMPFYASRGSIWGMPYGSYPPDTTNPPEPANVAGGKAFWFDPGEQLYTLSLAYPYLNPALQGQLRTYIQAEMNRFAPLAGLPYCCTSFDWKTQGQSREPYPIPAPIRNAAGWPPPGVSIQTIYALWAYAKYTGDWNYVQNNWTAIKALFDARKTTVNLYGRIPGAIGYARIARQLGHTAEATEGESVAVAAMQNSLDFSTWLNRANTLYPKGASGTSPWEKPGRRGQVFFGLTPEIGKFLHDTNLAAVDLTLNDLITYPYNTHLWYATRLGLMGEMQENSYLTPEIAWSTFLAQAYIKGATQDQLRFWLDRPWGLGDMYYLQKLVATIEAPSESAMPTPTPAPIACTISSASWNPATITEGSTVNLNVTGTGNCTGKQVSFEVRRNGLPLIGDIPAVTQPNPQTFASGSATLTTTWTAEHNPQFLLTDPDYYFNATVDGVTTKSFDPMLHVTGASGTPAEPNAWVMAGANPQRTSHVDSTSENQTEIKTQVNVEWYKKIDPYISSKVQIIAANDSLYVATSKGLYAFDVNGAGNIKWIYCTSNQQVVSNPSSNSCPADEMPLGHSPTYYNGTIYVGGYDKKIHALDANSGANKWTFTAEQGFDTNPLVVNDTVYAGNRDGNFYAINVSNGQERWRFKTDGPIHFSAAYKDNTVYFASNDMYAYALNATSGSLVWKSQKFPGLGFYMFWPVIYTEPVTNRDYVIFAGTRDYAVNMISGNHVELDREIYPHNDSSDPEFNNLRLVGPTGTEPYTWASGSDTVDASAITNYLEGKPYRRTVFALDRQTGQEYTFDSDGDGRPEYPPLLFHGTHGGNRFPPVVGGDKALYITNNFYGPSWISRGGLTGWKWGTPYLYIPSTTSIAVDEPMSYSSGGNSLYWMHGSFWEAGNIDLSRPNTILPGEGVPDQFGRDRFIVGWDFNNKLPSYLEDDWTHPYYGNQRGSVLVPYKGKLYTIHHLKTIIAFSPTGTVSFNPSPTPTPPAGNLITPTNQAVGLNTHLSIPVNGWPSLYTQNKYNGSIGETSFPQFTIQSFELAKVSASDTLTPVSSVDRSRTDTTFSTFTFGANTLTSYVSQRTPGMLFTTDANLLKFDGSFTNIAYPTSTGTRVASVGSATLTGSDLSESWMLVWDTANSPRFTPLLISLEKKPTNISLTSTGLRMSYSGAAGAMVITPLYGLSNPALSQGQAWANGLPIDVVSRAQLLNRISKVYPTNVTESYDTGTTTNADVTITENYTFTNITDEWNTQPLKLAFIPPHLALAAFNSSPIRINGQPLESHRDLQYPTPLGRVAGVENVDSITIALPQLTKYWREDFTQAPPAIDPNDPIYQKLLAEVDKMLAAGHLRTGNISTGLLVSHSRGVVDFIGDFYHTPGDTINTLIRLLPLLPADKQNQLKTYIQNEFTKYPPYLYAHLGWADGMPREDYEIPPDVAANAANRPAANYLRYYETDANGIPGVRQGYDIQNWNLPPVNLYATYLYAQAGLGNANTLYQQISNKLETPKFIASFPYTLNSYISGHMGYLKLARLASSAPRANAEKELIDMLILRTALFKYPPTLTQTGFEWNNYGLIVQNYDPNSGKLDFKRVQQGYHFQTGVDRLSPNDGDRPGAYWFTLDFINLSPETDKFLADYARQGVQDSVSNYTNRAPYWFVSRPEEFPAEGAFVPSYDMNAYFQAKAQILGEPRSELEKYLDIPAFARGDLYYIQNLASALYAPSQVVTPSPLPTPIPCTLTSASWGATSVVEGGNIVFNTTTSGNCSGKSVNFEVRRNLNLQPDQATTNQPNPNPVNLTPSGSNYTATSSWIADTWVNNCPLNPLGTCDPEYFFKVNLVGETNTTDSDPRLITVTKATISPPNPNDWPQVQKDAGHTGYVPYTVAPPTSSTAELWRWTGAPVSIRVQPIIADSFVFMPSQDGKLYAIDKNTGLTSWTYTTPSGKPLLASAGFDNGTVFFGSTDKSVYAVEVATHNLKWRFETKGSIRSAPTIANNTVYIGSTDGKMYALDAGNGSKKWEYDTGAPVLDTAAFDNGRIFFGSMNAKGYALNVSDGTLAWEKQLYGQGFRDRWTVAGNGKVIFTPMPYYPPGDRLGAGTGVLTPIYNQSWSAQRSAIINFFNSDLFQRTTYILNTSDGSESEAAPILYTSGGSTSPHSQPVVLPNGNFNVIYRYTEGLPNQGCYNTCNGWSMYVGEYNPTTNDITQLDTWGSADVTRMDTAKKVMLISDESSSLLRSGNIIYIDSSRGLVGFDTTAKQVLPFATFITSTGGVYWNPPIKFYGEGDYDAFPNIFPEAEQWAAGNDYKRPTPLADDVFYIFHRNTLVAAKGVRK